MDKYTYILDIQSLDLVILKHLELIKEEDKRITFLNSQLNKKVELLSDYNTHLSLVKSQLVMDEKELDLTNTQIDRNSVNLMSATNDNQLKILENEKISSTKKKEELEDRIFSNMLTTEDLNKDIAEASTFITGIKETIEEATIERNEIYKKHTSEIEKLDSQIEGLLSELEENLKKTFIKCREKYRFNNPVAVLNDLSCSKCRFQNARQEVENLKKTNSYLMCSSCGRMLISHN